MKKKYMIPQIELSMTLMESNILAGTQTAQENYATADNSLGNSGFFDDGEDGNGSFNTSSNLWDD